MAANTGGAARVSDGLYIGENFASNDSVADAAIGTVNWEIATIGNATTYALLTGQPYGGLRATTNTTANGDGSVLRTFTDGLALNTGGGYVKCRVRYPEITGNQLAGNNFRIGFQDSVTATSPVVGLWIDSDAGVISLQADSSNGDVSAAAGSEPNPTTLTSDTTMVKGTWHEFELVWFGSNTQTNPGPDSALLSVDGVLTAALRGTVAIESDETGEFSLAHWQDSGSGATLELDIDYLEFFQARKP